MQHIMFLKNFAMVGKLLAFTLFGADRKNPNRETSDLSFLTLGHSPVS
ncbi:hypothetical protein NTGHW29_70076 [Candidatus Nitrotoga sp. HW29]|nr:hypothetical protein NTGHW29_70076 [Candidatus Nitrotoga sp. HW29]